MAPRERDKEAAAGARTGASRARILLARACSDPWRKAAAIALAILLWYFLDSRLTKTTTLTCALQVVDAGGAFTEPDQPQSVLNVRIPMRTYTAKSFHALSDAEPIGEVVLYFEGPDHVIDTIRPNELFHVRAERSGASSFEFDKDMIDGDRDLVQALKRMEPARVVLDVEANADKEVTLTPEHVEFRVLVPSTNGGTPHESRLQMDRASFNPGFVRLYGTKSDLEEIEKQTAAKLFELVLRDSDFTGNSEIKAPLSLRKFKDARNAIIPIRCEPMNPEITVPLTPDFESYLLKEAVNVILDVTSTEHTVDDFEPVKPHSVTLDVESNSTPAIALYAMDDEERRAWAEANLRVLVHLPKDFDPGRTLVGRLVFVDPAYDNLRPGRDYQYAMLPITLVPKNK